MSDSSIQRRAILALMSTRKKFLDAPFEEIDAVSEEPIVVAESNDEDSEKCYWWIELCKVQEWCEDNIRIVQCSLDLRSDDFHCCTMIHFHNDGRPSLAEAIWEYQKGVPVKKIDEFTESQMR